MQEADMVPDQAEHPRRADAPTPFLVKQPRILQTRVWDYLSAAFVVIGCAIAIIPFAPSFPEDELDSAWAFALNAAVGRGLAFGHDIVFTFGPYASLYTSSYHPATDRLAMLAGAILAIALAAGLIALMRDGSRWIAMLLAVLLTLPALKDPFFLAVPLVFLAVIARFVACRSRGSASQATRGLAVAGVVLVIALALLPLVKATFGVAAALALLASGLLLLRRDWRLAAGAACLFLLAMAGLWRLAHQDLANLPHYFIAQRQIIAGYTEAMALPGPAWQLAVFWVAAAGVLAANLRPAMRAGLPGMAMCGVAALLMFLAFKAGFIRQDEHVAIGAGALGLIAAILALHAPNPSSIVGLAIGLAGWAVLGPLASGPGPAADLQRLGSHYLRSAAGAVGRLTETNDLAAQYAGALAKIRADHKLPKLSGSTDIYSEEQSIPLAYGLPWSPRPVLQSYSAWSLLLETIDAQHLTGPDAPQNVLILLSSIDNRLPSLEDGLSWLPLLTRYEAVSLRDQLAVLRRLEGEVDLSPFASRTAPSVHRLGDEVKLEGNDAPIWAEIDVKPTALGHLMGALFRPPPLSIAMHLANGSVYRFRYVASMGKSGFLISPLVGNAAELIALTSPVAELFGNRVAGFTIEGDQRFWNADYTIALSTLHLPSRQSARTVLFQKPAPTRSGGDAVAKCYLDQINGQIVDHHASKLQLSGPVRASGWGFGGDIGGIAPDSAFVSLTAEDGTVLGIPAALGNRPDVGAYFHQPSLVRIGFLALLDTSALSGSYKMALELQAHGHHWSCPLFDTVEISSPSATP